MAEQWKLEEKYSYKTGKKVASVCWSPDGEKICSGDENCLCIWDRGEEKKHYRKMIGKVNSVSWSPDGKKICCGVAVSFHRADTEQSSKEGKAPIIRLWDETLN